MANSGPVAGSKPHWEEPDVLIVGAGASGAAVAYSLAEAGFRVVCLEQGDWVEPASLPTNDPLWEIRRLTDFNPDPNVRQLPADYPVNNAASTFSPSLSGISMLMLIALSDMRIANCPLLRIVFAIDSAVDNNSDCGTTAVTSPMRNASCAVI